MHEVNNDPRSNVVPVEETIVAITMNCQVSEVLVILLSVADELLIFGDPWCPWSFDSELSLFDPLPCSCLTKDSIDVCSYMKHAITIFGKDVIDPV